MMMTRKATDPAARAECLEAWDASGVTCVFQNAGEEHDSPLRIMKRLARFTYAADLLRDVAPRAACPADVEDAHRSGKHAFYFSANAVPLQQDWVTVEDELRYIRIFFQLGIRMMHLTYNRRNVIGDGCAEPANAGLSDFGRSVVKEMNRVGVIVDIAHSGFQTSLEAALASEQPMVASHSGAHALSGHYRCKPDEVIKAVADTGGFCGVCCIPRFLGGTGDINAFLDHIEHLRNLVGADHIAIGTDVSYIPESYEAECKKIPSRGPRRDAWRTYWPNTNFGDPQWSKPEQRLSMAWTNWPMFTVGMVQRGIPDDEIRKILGLNVMRVAKAAWENREA
jgi:membrane dipeptidase